MLLGIQMLCFKVVKVLANIGGLPVKELKDMIEGCSSKGADQWANPVDPVIAWERVIDDSGTKCPCRVDASTSKLDALLQDME